MRSRSFISRLHDDVARGLRLAREDDSLFLITLKEDPGRAKYPARDWQTFGQATKVSWRIVMNKNGSTSHTQCANLPPLLDIRGLAANFKIGRTAAYLLASKGEITSLTLGTPGKHGKRVFLTKSVIAYISRRVLLEDLSDGPRPETITP
jgi:hypothetical protein